MTITLTGIDKQKLGQVAAELNRLRKPDAYKGKGVRYADKQYKLKPGKTGNSKGIADFESDCSIADLKSAIPIRDMAQKSRADIRRGVHSRIRKKVRGSAERPRLAVFRSLNHIYAQVIDDDSGKTLATASTTEKAFSGRPAAILRRRRRVGKTIAERAHGGRRFERRFRSRRLCISRAGQGAA